MKHFRRKLFATLLILMMLVSTFASLSASATGGTVTVYFTQGNTQGTNNGEVWLGTGSNLFGFGATVVEIDEIDLSKDYIPVGETDLLNGEPSVLDAILTAATVRYLDVQTGWDAYPWQGDPGAYLSNVNNMTLEAYYDEIDGVNYAWGTGFYVAVAPDSSSTPGFPTEYVSNVAVYDGMVIYVDLGTYSYSW